MKTASSITLLPRASAPLRFCFSGGMATALHYLSMLFLMQGGCSPAAATALGALAGALLNYQLHYRYTFTSQRQHRSAFSRYSAALALGWALNLLLFAGLHSALLLPVLMAQGLTTLCLAVCNYWVFKRYVFL
ncbi:MAG: GtrA family protein [Pigmentiphaga sp.]